MAIYSPEPKLSFAERELLRLLGELVTSQCRSENSNLPVGHAVLSEREAALLLELLEEISTSKKFIESAYFVEQITADLSNDEHLREIYLSRRKGYGRSRAMASTHWSNFLHRLGRVHLQVGYIRGVSRAMPYDYFRRMESILLKQSGINSRIRAIVLSVIDKYSTEVDTARRGERQIPPGAVSGLPATIISTLKDDSNNVDSSALPASQVAGLMTVIVDIPVMFTTRDWGVAGTMSTIAGGFAAGTYR